MSDPPLTFLDESPREPGRPEEGPGDAPLITGPVDSGPVTSGERKR